MTKPASAFGALLKIQRMKPEDGQQIHDIHRHKIFINFLQCLKKTINIKTGRPLITFKLRNYLILSPKIHKASQAHLIQERANGHIITSLDQ